MADRKRFIVLGLGSFGTALSRQLVENGCRVTGVDRDRELVENLKNLLYEAVIADVTERETLEALALKDADAVFVNLGEQLEPSLLAALHVKELGARRIVVKGVTIEHGKILKKMGVDRVVFPEVEIAQELANHETWPNVLDYMPIDPDYSFIEIAVPDSIAGQTLREADLRRAHHIWVVGIKDTLTGKFDLFPDPEIRIRDDHLLLIAGRKTDLNRFRELR
ncbi:MAG: TrkA family potassium uptake protein [Planctomycetes bacterium]|nr:TrkA family potassium uptake protein [Planctomycetota bacterium]